MIDPTRGATYRYAVEYRREDAPTDRTFRLTVAARDADHARLLVKVADPAFTSTVRSPRRGAQVR